MLNIIGNIIWQLICLFGIGTACVILACGILVVGDARFQRRGP